MDLDQTLVVTLTALAGVALLVIAMLKGWQGWLALKTRELDLAARAPRDPETGAAPTIGRIELADLKERVRRLEAIAAGVDL